MGTAPPPCPTPWGGCRGHAVAGLCLDMTLVRVNYVSLQLSLATEHTRCGESDMRCGGSDMRCGRIARGVVG